MPSAFRAFLRGTVAPMAALAFAAVSAPVVLTFGVLEAGAATLLVRPDGTGDYPTIQDAIDAALEGDVVELAEGVFTGPGNRDLHIAAAITLRSQGGDPAACVLDCEGSAQEHHWGIRCDYGPGRRCVVEGITIRRAYGFDGGAILVYGEVTFINCVIEDSASVRNGGGMYCEDFSSPRCIGCVFLRNRAPYGGAVHVYTVDAGEWIDCVFAYNEATGFAGGGVGGAFNVPSSHFIEISGCTFVGNRADRGAAIAGWNVAVGSCTFYAQEGNAIEGAAPLRLDRCIVAFSSGRGLVCASYGAPPELTCCDLYANQGGDWVDCIADQLGTEGNISEDPLFCDAPGGDLTLRADSPCADGHDPSCGLIGAWPVGCDTPVPVVPLTWGRVKSVFLR